MFDYTEIMNSEFFTIKRYQDSIYLGEVNDQNMREGYGIMIYLKNRVYEG